MGEGMKKNDPERGPGSCWSLMMMNIDVDVEIDARGHRLMVPVVPIPRMMVVMAIIMRLVTAAEGSDQESCQESHTEDSFYRFFHDGCFRGIDLKTLPSMHWSDGQVVMRWSGMGWRGRGRRHFSPKCH